MCSKSSSSYLLESFFEFFSKISMILRPLLSRLAICLKIWGVEAYLSWPIVSPEPSSLLQPAPADSSLPSQSFNSSADILTSSFHSLVMCLLIFASFRSAHNILNDGIVVLDHFDRCRVEWADRFGVGSLEYGLVKLMQYSLVRYSWQKAIHRVLVLRKSIVPALFDYINDVW